MVINKPGVRSVLEDTISEIEKDFGKGTIMNLNDDSQHFDDLSVIPTGSISLDHALGVGGIPRGRIIEIYGPESSGKTTISLQCIREVQKQGCLAAFIDAEYAFDKNYAENLGVDFNKLLFSQPNNGEEALIIAEKLIKTGEIDLIIIDSVAALVPKAEIDGEIGDCKVGIQARLMSQALRRITSVISKMKCACIFTNQLRDKIGVTFGNSEMTTGGNALKFFSSIRLDIRRIAQIKDDCNNSIGNRTRVKIVKNKVAPPFKTAEFDIYYGKGVSTIGEIIDLAIENKILQKNGSWFSYEERRLAQGRETLKNILEQDEQLCEKIKNNLMVIWNKTTNNVKNINTTMEKDDE